MAVHELVLTTCMHNIGPFVHGGFCNSMVNGLLLQINNSSARTQYGNVGYSHFLFNV